MLAPRTTEIAPSLFRISTFHPDFGIQFNQFLQLDDEPFLVHTGMRRMFDATLAGVRAVTDPAKLRWIGFSHFEPDECGALNDWLALAPQAQAVAGAVGALVMLGDYADRPPRVVADGEVVATGRRRMRYLATPHLPHGWDAGLWFEETSRTLFCSDLLFQPGDPAAITTDDLLPAVRAALVEGMKGPLAHDIPYTHETDAALRRLAALSPATLAIMHGSTYRGDGAAQLAAFADLLRETIGPR
ncbi:MAG: MBL fold metallo-hydrolase [Proteobacteria bacterium]|nr:MAG: MBL fold metallo-hydrolase [Pseudomonadota bacterium]